ncbi:hypothetical protein V6N12_032422 [Hibiscus sabdariffa]|uniref:Uncharacterized protein n=1 Tax=Hibiscus sabdariffa TaxID=183260 RepID=A0ABR2CE95_9ROSI
MATRYKSYDSCSSTSSSIDLSPSSSSSAKPKPSFSKALVKSNPSDVPQGCRSRTKPTTAPHHNLTSMVKRLVDGKSNNTGMGPLLIPSDVLAEGLKKSARKGTALTALQRKLFGNGSADKERSKKEVRALTEAKGNTRTLAMVLRSERELLTANKELETDIAVLKLQLQDKNIEAEKLKDLCLKQREEIKSLKSAVLFPDTMNSQLQELVETQGSELTQAKQLIPTLQRQVTSLTEQLQCLALDLHQMKADKYCTEACHQRHGSSSPMTPGFDGDEHSDSLEFSSGDPTAPGSPSDLVLEDLNPCLTPYYVKTKSKIQIAIRIQVEEDAGQPGHIWSDKRLIVFDDLSSRKLPWAREVKQTSAAENCKHALYLLKDQTKMSSRDISCATVLFVELTRLITWLRDRCSVLFIRSAQLSSSPQAMPLLVAVLII